MSVERALANLPTLEGLERGRPQALTDFRDYLQEHAKGQSQRYSDEHAAALLRVERLFEKSNDLLDLCTMNAISDDVSVARFLVAGEQTSADDLKLISLDAGRTDKSRTRVAFIASFLDPIRFPWVELGRPPTDAERAGAMKWTAGIMASQRTATNRRMEMARRQEAATRAAIEKAGYRRGAWPLQPGEFGLETVIAGVKSDAPIRLRCGRHLLLEDKVSGSATNSVKRVNHEVTDKFEKWRRGPLDEQPLVGTVLAGAFLPAQIEQLHAAGVLVFWEHDLDVLTQFILEADRD